MAKSPLIDDDGGEISRNGYWYLTQLKKFAESIGIPSSKRQRKDELENSILVFPANGTCGVSDGASTPRDRRQGR